MIRIKGTVRVLPSEYPCKVDTVRFTAESSKLSHPKKWTLPPLFLLKKCSFLGVSPLLFISKKRASHSCRETRTLISNSYLTNRSVQGYRCESALPFLDGE